LQNVHFHIYALHIVVIASPLLNARETATRLRVSEATVRRLARRGELPHLLVGSQIRVDAAELEAWLHRDVSDADGSRQGQLRAGADPAERDETSKSARQSNSSRLAGAER
jgi:excisionase family DNA binding protein